MINNGIIVPILLLLPNFLFFINKNNIETSGIKANLIIRIIEKVSRIGVFVIPILYEINLDTLFNKSLLTVMLILLIIYYLN